MGIVRAMQDKVRQIQADPRHRGVTFWLGCFKPGGIGDYLTLCAFARAAKRHWQARLGAPSGGGSRVRTTWGGDTAGERQGDTVGVVVIGRECGLPLDYDKTHGQPDINGHFSMPEIGWAFQASKLAPLFDAFYDVRYTVRAHIRDKARFAVEDAEARDRLDSWRFVHDFFPWSSQYLESRVGLSQWELMSETAGFPVTPDDLFVNTETVTFGEFTPNALPGLADLGGCVTLHNGEGGHGTTKCMPRDVPRKVAEVLLASGLTPVQVGRRDEDRDPMIPGCLDMRGLRLTESAAIIAKARLHVDVEGGLVYIARAVQTQSVVFFGPTPASVFGFYGNVNYSRRTCPRPPGPHCWWSSEGWAMQCQTGHKNCENLPQPETAARVVLDALRAQETEQVEMRRERVQAG